MPHEGNYTFAGIANVEAQDRRDEYRTGVPSLGDGQSVLDAPAPGARQILQAVHAHNTGDQAAWLRLMHQGTVKTVTAELLTALAVTATRYSGRLQYRAVVPGSVTITNAGAPADIVDDGNGLLVDIGTTTQRGTIDYANGVVDFTYGAGPTEPVTVDYDHTDCVDFASATQTTTFTGGTAPAGAYPETLALTFGRVVPGSVSLTDGVETFVDDGKGNMVETTGGIASVEGSIDYATGVITLTGGTGTLADPTTATYQFNPFASLLAAGAGQALMDLFNSQIPELTQEPWADGLSGEARICLWAESRAAAQTNLVTQWVHAGEDPFRVEAPFSGFPPGGHDNDPRIIGG